MSSYSKSYFAGSCNIGPKEIRKRYLFGFIGFAISAIVVHMGLCPLISSRSSLLG
ncbi:MAG: hypothetical protein QXL94_03020 [Candidatus Parvarchaeum sp.]